jgi:3'5'-cyclic nucleotide phosphodiesterase/Adenylate and Guanylate cyclase catalytic domain
MNTASRMESSGVPGRIHISQETAALLSKAGKAHWIVSRETTVSLKGKGQLQTFFVSSRATTSNKTTDYTSSGSYLDPLHIDLMKSTQADIVIEERMQRMVDWNVEVLHAHLLKLVAARQRTTTVVLDRRGVSQREKLGKHQDSPVEVELVNRDTQVIDEMTDILSLPQFMERDHENELSQEESLLLEPAKEQLRDFVSRIAHLYRDVPFHNFEHASHVTMSAGKLMKRILHPEGATVSSKESKVTKARQIHETTYGISSDPLLQFAVVFAALIHDVDHTGLNNTELVDCGAEVAVRYDGKSVAEQNSVSCAWNVLMDGNYSDLRQCIFTTREEQQRFRQMIVNAVMATDIADKELQARRKERWDMAFQTKGSSKGVAEDDSLSQVSDRKATIVLEYIIQASDVAHCMQHWLTYQKFNRRLFEERYLAWLKSCSNDARDPAEHWYEGEMQFFDKYIIPLAEKLEECGVFGVTYHECLNYAQQNRVEWERKGESIVAEMLVECQKKYGSAVYFDP